MSNTTTLIHDVESVLVKPVTLLHWIEDEPQSTHTQDIIIKTEDGSRQIFTAFFCAAVNERLEREANSAATVTGALRQDRDVSDDLKCEDCGAVDDTVEEKLCPYASDLYDENIVIVVCEECYHQRAMDI